MSTPNDNETYIPVRIPPVEYIKNKYNIDSHNELQKILNTSVKELNGLDREIKEDYNRIVNQNEREYFKNPKNIERRRQLERERNHLKKTLKLNSEIEMPIIKRVNANENIRKNVINILVKNSGFDENEIERILNNKSKYGLTDIEKQVILDYRKIYQRESKKDHYRRHRAEITQKFREKYNKNPEYYREQHRRNRLFANSIKSLMNSDFMNEEMPVNYDSVQDFELNLSDIDSERVTTKGGYSNFGGRKQRRTKKQKKTRKLIS